MWLVINGSDCSGAGGATECGWNVAGVMEMAGKAQSVSRRLLPELIADSGQWRKPAADR